MKFLTYFIMAVLSLMTVVEAGRLATRLNKPRQVSKGSKPCYAPGGILIDCSTPPPRHLAKRQN